MIVHAHFGPLSTTDVGLHHWLKAIEQSRLCDREVHSAPYKWPQWDRSVVIVTLAAIQRRSFPAVRLPVLTAGAEAPVRQWHVQIVRYS